MREAGDALLDGAEALSARLQRADRLREGVEGVVDALAAAAEAVAAEAARAPIRLPPIAEGPDGLAPRPLPPPEAPGTDELIRRAASSLPRRRPPQR